MPLPARVRSVLKPSPPVASLPQTPAREQQLEALLRRTQPQRMAGQVSGSVTHDFNNCLAIISGSLDLLEHRLGTGADAPAANVMRLVVRARDAVQRAATLSAGLHALSQLKPEGIGRIDVEQLVNGMLQLLGSVIGRRIRLHLAVAADLPAAATDPGRLKAALVALFLNAREAMSEGGDLTCDIAPCATSEGPFIRVQLVDTGVGMTPEVAARAVEPFFTTNEATRVGLGLSEVAAFAAEAGGRLQIEAVPEGGAAVSLLLPCATG